MSRLEKSIIGIIIFLLIVVISGVYWLRNDSSKDNNVGTQNIVDNNGLADVIDLYPSNCNLYEPFPGVSFTTKEDKVINTSNFRGKTLIIMFWASWCGGCNKEFEKMDEFISSINKYQNVELILVNRLDGEKETKEQALKYLESTGVEIDTLFDKDESVYKELGINKLPTTLIVDTEGYLRTIYPGSIYETSVLEGLIEYAVYGGAYATEQFIISNFQNDFGGIWGMYSDNGKIEKEVLVESQGLLLEYALLTNNQSLFNTALKYIDDNLSEHPLKSWVKPEDGEASSVNALIDDLRIYKALVNARNKWGITDESLYDYSQAILTYNTKDNQPVDFYDFDKNEKAQRFTLCYGDFETLRLLAVENKSFQEVYDKTLKLVTEGYISDAFPLYYSYYDYDKKDYQKVELNMAEALLTVLHLAQIGEVKQETIQWIRERMEDGGIKARYNVNGDVSENYNFDSTAVNALVALIAGEIGDAKLRSIAIQRMEQLRDIDKSSKLYGAFGTYDTPIHAFDQLIPLLVYGDLQ